MLFSRDSLKPCNLEKSEVKVGEFTKQKQQANRMGKLNVTRCGTGDQKHEENKLDDFTEVQNCRS